MIEFRPNPKVPRYFRDIVISEKIDGTSGAIAIVDALVHPVDPVASIEAWSKNRVITPEQDNHGFARWVHANAESLVPDLGPGIHRGEWWGSGIQRGYGLPKGEKRFSLFNTTRHVGKDFQTPGLGVVPVLYEGPHDYLAIDDALCGLRNRGSLAAPDFDRPEGICIFHTASNSIFKITLENDEAPKSLVSA